MGVSISYMGTKHQLAKVVADIVHDLPKGPLLDAFAGMSAIGMAIGEDRPVWTNEILKFPAIVARTMFCSMESPMKSQDAKSMLKPFYMRNYRALAKRNEKHLALERRYLESVRFNHVVAGNVRMPHVVEDRQLNIERRRLERKPGTFPYRLSTIFYPGSYFGIEQCIEIDSMRYAIQCVKNRGLVSNQQYDWFLIALGQVLSKVNNSTGQFAQFIKPSKDNLSRIIEKRKRSVWKEFFPTLDSITPVGSSEWRAHNRAFCTDTLKLLSRLARQKNRPAVVYADPPYSAAQHSRYYHVLDVILRYDYPELSGAGRYPIGRFQTPFANSRTVLGSMRKLFQDVRRTGASFVLSYPENGLMVRQGYSIVKLLREHFPYVEKAYSGRHKHSTFGGPLARPKVSVIENVYVAHA